MLKPYLPEQMPVSIDKWNMNRMLIKLSNASSALAYYDGILTSMINTSIFLSPLATREAILSSKIEGTVTTMDEVLKFEAGMKPINPHKQNDIIEVLNYHKATIYAQDWLKRGMPFNSTMLCSIHRSLMQGVRGEKKRPGEIRQEMVWIGPRDCAIEQATYLPPEPGGLKQQLDQLMTFAARQDYENLLQTALLHAQFELLHPFLDGNGRTGRILIPLFLWHKKKLHSPSFYISEYFDNNRDDYMNTLSSISRKGNWEEWVLFFLDAIAIQASSNAKKASQVLELYAFMKNRITEISRSPNAIHILDTLFLMPVFSSRSFMKSSGLNPQTSFRMIQKLKESGILSTIRKPMGSAPEILRFDKLYRLVR